MPTPRTVFSTYRALRNIMTTNCVVPPKASYQDRLFTTGATGVPGCAHIDAVDGKKDFSAVIALAKKCAAPTELEQGQIVGGFAHGQAHNCR